MRELQELPEVEQIGRLTIDGTGARSVRFPLSTGSLKVLKAQERTQSSSPRWMRFWSSTTRFSPTSSNALAGSPPPAASASFSAERLFGRPRPIPLGP